MQLIQTHPVEPQRDATGGTLVGLVDVELNPDVRLYKLRIVRLRNGKHRLFAPFTGRFLSASFSRPLAEEITALAVDALELVPANDD